MSKGCRVLAATVHFVVTMGNKTDQWCHLPRVSEIMSKIFVSLLLSIDVLQCSGALMCFNFRGQCAGVFHSRQSQDFYRDRRDLLT